MGTELRQGGETGKSVFLPGSDSIWWVGHWLERRGKGTLETCGATLTTWHDPPNKGLCPSLIIFSKNEPELKVIHVYLNWTLAFFFQNLSTVILTVCELYQELPYLKYPWFLFIIPLSTDAKISIMWIIKETEVQPDVMVGYRVCPLQLKSIQKSIRRSQGRHTSLLETTYINLGEFLLPYFEQCVFKALWSTNNKTHGIRLYNL